VGGFSGPTNQAGGSVVDLNQLWNKKYAPSPRIYLTHPAISNNKDDDITSAMLCEKCKVIIIDDLLPGLHETTIDDGQVVLDSKDYFLELNFDRWDTFPDLPDLQSSAQHGCGFCGLLRDTLQEIFTNEFAKSSKYHDVDPRIHLHQLKYKWDKYTGYQNPPGDWNTRNKRWEGICFLEVQVRNAEDTFFWKGGFDVVADEGRLDLLTEIAQLEPQSAEKNTG